MTLEIDRRGAVDWVTFNRPDRLNALSPELVEALHEYFDSLSRDTDTRVVLLRGAGRAFCAGADLRAIRAGDTPISTGLAHFLGELGRVFTRIEASRLPTIAAVNGLEPR